jgi:hypothetical protein
MAAWLEAIQLAGFSKKEADKLFGKQVSVKGFENYLSPATPFFVRKKFVNRFNELYTLRDGGIKSDDNRNDKKC